VFDAANLLSREQATALGQRFAGIGRGHRRAPEALVEEVIAGFRWVEAGVANEVQDLAEFLNQRYAEDGFNRIVFETVQRIAATCPTGCAIGSPGKGAPGRAFPSKLVECARSG
jgi:hypothetical protein